MAVVSTHIYLGTSLLGSAGVRLAWIHSFFGVKLATAAILIAQSVIEQPSWRVAEEYLKRTFWRSDGKRRQALARVVREGTSGHL